MYNTADFVYSLGIQIDPETSVCGFIELYVDGKKKYDIRTQPLPIVTTHSVSLVKVNY